MKPIRVMKTNRTVRWTTILAVAAALLLTGLAFQRAQDAARAQTGGGYDLTWSSIDGGGYTFSTGGGYSLGGTVGQPDAGVMTGGGYTLGGGFWGGGALAAQHQLYLPLVLR
jgi:hypothetical protein